MKKTLLMTALVTAAVLPATTLTPPAQAHAATIARSSTPTFSDEAVIEFFATGQGPLASMQADLAGFVPAGTPSLTSDELTELTEEYRAADANFHADVTEAVQSGDPFRTLDGLRALQRISKKIAAEHGVQTGTGSGKCATVLVVALAFWVVLAVVPLSVDAPQDDMTNEKLAADLAAAFA
ncbi:hypothetical protein [Curtobacterium sp. PhB78]|uniref:hypothetical protein n=1 Tax=Curtobacterium sp. PhB78 TaxID=2485102 RepID=UPI000F9724C5|nr:hypothetical protein [Curtobacterium sp. PhB78]ROS47022.1 SdpC family antimicrobial peptide [Curtobacterium sp. PhB78]